MMAIRHIFGIVLVAAGGVVLVLAAILFNQELEVVPVPWGIFDITLGAFGHKEAINVTTATIGLAIVGMGLFATGLFLFRCPGSRSNTASSEERSEPG